MVAIQGVHEQARLSMFSLRRIHYLNHVHWLEHKINLWVYPILNQLSLMHRGLFLSGSALFNVGLYFVGEAYTRVLAGRCDRIGGIGSTLGSISRYESGERANQQEEEELKRSFNLTNLF